MATLTSQLIVRLIDQVTGPARAVGRSLLGISKAADGAAGTSGRIADALARNNRALDQTRGQLVDAVAGFFVLKNAFAAPLNAAGRFEGQLEDIGQKVNLAVSELPALGEKVKKVARDTNQAASQIASAVDALAGRGASLDVALTAADPIGKAATAYRAATDDLAAASWAAVDNLKVPADQIEKALDMMAQAGKEGAFELRDMAQYFPSLGAAYQGLGQTGVNAVGDLAAALQVVRKGTGDASTAATNLSNVLQKTYAPATIKAFNKAGVDLRKEMAKAAKEGKTPIEALAEITNKTLKGDLSKLGNLFEDAQVQGGLRSLIQNMDEYRRIRENAQNASGIIDEDFARRIRTAQGVMARWNATIQNLSISIGTALVPAINEILDKIIPVIEKLGEWTSANPELVRNVIAATGAIIGFKVALIGLRFVGLLGRGGALSMLALGFNTVGRAAIGATAAVRNAVGLQRALGAMDGKTLSGFQTFTTALGAIVRAVPGVSAIGTALSAVGTALAAISAPAWLAIGAAVAVVAGAGALLWKYWDRVSSVASGIAKRIGEELSPAIEKVRPLFEALKPAVSAIGDAFAYVGEKIGEFFDWIGSFFEREVLNDEQKAKWEKSGYDAADLMIKAIKMAFDGLVDWAANIGSRIGDAIASRATAALNNIRGYLPSWAGGIDAPPSASNDNAAPPARSGHRATGGPAWAGSSYLVGEKGPEIFSPKSSGTVTPAGKMGNSVTFGDIHIHGTSDPAETARIAVDLLEARFNRAMRGVHADMGAR